MGTLGGLAAIGLWSATIAVVRRLSEQVGPLTAGAAVYSVAGLVCLIRLGRSSGRGFSANDSTKYLLGTGSLFVLYTIFLYRAIGLAQDREQALGIGLINYLWPTFTLLFSLALLQQRADWRLLPGTALALMGIFVVMNQGTRLSWMIFARDWAKNPAAYGLAFGAALSWALYSNLTRRWAATSRPDAVLLFIPATALCLWGLRSVLAEQTLWSVRAVLETGFLGGVTALAYILWDTAMKRGDLPLVAACSYFTPLLSTLVSCAYLGVTPAPSLWLGCVLLVLGSLLSWSAFTRFAIMHPKLKPNPGPG